MTNFENVWGNTSNKWMPIDRRTNELLSACIVFAWVGMIAFFVSGLFVVVTRNDISVALMLLFLVVWLGSGIAAIRIRHRRRKSIVISNVLPERRSS